MVNALENMTRSTDASGADTAVQRRNETQAADDTAPRIFPLSPTQLRQLMGTHAAGR